MGRGSGHSKGSWWPRSPYKGEGPRRGKDRTTLPVSCASAPFSSEPEASPMDVEPGDQVQVPGLEPTSYVAIPAPQAIT